MKRTTKTMATFALALSLAAVPLAACSSKSADSAQTSQLKGVTPTAEDVASWKTMGDALAYDHQNMNTGYNEDYYVAVYNSGDAVIRVVAKMVPGMNDKLFDLDFMAEDYDEQLASTIGELELVSAEDITGQKLSQDELNAYVGKTGQDMVNDGFAFEGYVMYGGEQTSATLTKGYFGYTVTFDTTVAEDQTEDGGAAIMGATISAIEYGSPAMSATDPTTVA